jgi:two-component sensor histidine kinase
MLKYGVMQDWDQRIRAWEREKRGEKAMSMVSGDGDGPVDATAFAG